MVLTVAKRKKSTNGDEVEKGESSSSSDAGLDSADFAFVPIMLQLQDRCLVWLWSMWVDGGHGMADERDNPSTAGG